MKSSAQTIGALPMNKKATLYKASVSSLFSLLASVACISPVYALPSGGNVTHGSATINPPNNGEVLIPISSSRTVIEWDSYNLASGEVVDYLGMNPTDSVLNIINQGDTSIINGDIYADGRVFLVNTHGFIFGTNARVSAGGLIASSLSVNPDQFATGGTLNFFATDDKGAVINNGNLYIDLGGNVALLGNSVINNGTIQALAGSVTLAAGEAMTLDFDGNGLLQIAVTQEVSENMGNLRDAVRNSSTGTLSSSYITLEAHVAADVFTNAVNHEGLIEAAQFIIDENGFPQLVNEGGQGGIVRLVGMEAAVAIADTSTISATDIEVVEVLPDPGTTPPTAPPTTPPTEPPTTPTTPGSGGSDGGSNNGGDDVGQGSTPPQTVPDEDDGPVNLLSALANSDEPAHTQGIGSTSNSSLGLYNVEAPGVRLPADQLEEEL